jgi:hypothetical protein
LIDKVPKEKFVTPIAEIISSSARIALGKKL